MRQELSGSCHCGNIRYRYGSPVPEAEIAARACGCSFCTRHGAAYTSHVEGWLQVVVDDASLLLRYRFGTGSADFFVCARCGIVVLATSDIGGALYGVINVRTLPRGALLARRARATTFDGESAAERLQRRRLTWIPKVEVRFGAAEQSRASRTTVGEGDKG